jgi:hypothetical protein
MAAMTPAANDRLIPPPPVVAEAQLEVENLV